MDTVHTIDEPLRRPRTVSLTGALLLVQWIVFLGIGILHMARRMDPYRLTDTGVWLLDVLVIRADHARLLSVIFLILALGSLLAALGFFRLWYLAWLLATATQGTALLATIVIYFTDASAYVYPVMVLSIVLVSYLNYPEVQETFRSREAGFCRRVAK